jgi:hypothetical protein
MHREPTGAVSSARHSVFAVAAGVLALACGRIDTMIGAEETDSSQGIPDSDPGPAIPGDAGDATVDAAYSRIVVCPPGLTCNVSCGDAGTTTRITGKVYDPAGRNPLYNVAVYVPATSLRPLPKGVPTGADACSCHALFKSGALTATSTAVDGTFTLTNVPVGDLTLVLQIGKWRRAIKVSTRACEANAQTDKSLTLPGTLMGAGPDDNVPDIAVSTGEGDTLECLLTRIGVPAAEYVAGAGTTGHVHIFSGGAQLDAGGGGIGVAVGKPEACPMPGAPSSSTDLWMTQDQLMRYDVTLLSCEGGETYHANPQALEAYLNAGGRAFGSHFHYSFFAGPLGTMQHQKYGAPPAWGTNLANWSTDTASGLSYKGLVGGTIVTTLNGTTTQFPKGAALQQWLAGVGALGTDGVPSGDVAIYQPRYNAIVLPANKPSQAWITNDPASADAGIEGGIGAAGEGGIADEAMYFSFGTPVGAPVRPAAPQFCGRAVFSDLHVTGNPRTNDTSSTDPRAGGKPAPAGCDAAIELSPQEKVLEFMLFDLSSCVLSDTVAPPLIPPI